MTFNRIFLLQVATEKLIAANGFMNAIQLLAMNMFHTVSFPMYLVYVSFKEQVGHATQAELFKHRRIFF